MADEIEAGSLDQEGRYAPLGEVLLAARKAKKLSQSDVSSALRISVKQIDAIENNQFDLLPESAITRGFIRNYARHLGLDTEPLLASHRQRVPEALPASLSVKTSTRQVMSTEDHKPWLKYILGSILALLMLLAWFFYMDYMPKAPKVIQDLGEATDLPEVALPAAERQSDNAVVAPSAALPSPAPQNHAPAPVTSSMAATPVATSAAAPTAVSAVSVPSNVPPEPVNASPVIPTNKVGLTVSEETWVRAKDQSGKVVFEKTLSAGETSGFDAEPPLLITIGNAKAAQLQYLGQAVDLTASTKGNVARVKLP